MKAKYTLIAASITLLLLLAGCGGLPSNLGDVAQTAQAGAATAQSAASTAAAGLDFDVTALAGTASALGQDGAAIAATAQAAGLNPEAIQGTALALASTAQVVATQLATQVVATDREEAEIAIVTYAREVLGITVSPLYAGGLTTEVNRTVDLSAQTGTDLSSTLALAGVSYGALFDRGGAILAFGDGTASGDFQVDINTASLGSYSLLVSDQFNSPQEGLDLALRTYPALANRQFDYLSPTNNGHSWRAVGQQPGFDRDGSPALITEVVIVGVNRVGTALSRQIVVFAVVTRGVFASELMP